MTILTRRSVLRGSVGLAAAGALARPYIANAAATTAEMWWVQGFAKEEDIALKKMVADYEKASGNKIDLSIIPFAPLRQKAVAAIQSGVVPDIMNTPDLEFAPLNSWDDKFLDVSDIVETQKKDFAPIAIESCFLYNGVTKKRGYTVVPLRITGLAVSYLAARWSKRRAIRSQICQILGMRSSISSCRCRINCAPTGCATSTLTVIS